jgi:hypothetical protein
MTTMTRMITTTTLSSFVMHSAATATRSADHGIADMQLAALS